MSGRAVPRRLAVVGGGWAGLAAAVRAVEAGHSVTLFETSHTLGGRARSLPAAEGAHPLDNGQHILIGAYQRTLALMRTVGASPEDLLSRSPLALRFADGRGLVLPPGAALPAFVRGVLGADGWTFTDKAALLWRASRWALAGFRCPADLTVEQLCAGLPPRVRSMLFEPLSVAALNTPSHDASAALLLRVLKDAVFGGRGAADLLLPRRGLSDLLPRPAGLWLERRGAEVKRGRRVGRLAPDGTAWRVEGEPFEAVVLATSAVEAARLVQDLPLPRNAGRAWAATAAALPHEPIVTVYLDAPGARLPCTMTALAEGPESPAQFAFDHGALGGAAGRFAFVVSGAAAWVERGTAVLTPAVLAQARAALQCPPGAAGPDVLRVVVEKRATFRCRPGLLRPSRHIAPGLLAAGDYIEGPYPATLEGAVLSGEGAAAALD